MVIGLNAKITLRQMHIDFNLELGRRQRNSTGAFFIPLSAEQIQALKRYRKVVPETQAPGLVRFHLAHGGNRHLRALDFYPFGEHNYAVEGKHKPTRRGIATLVEHAITEYLAKRFPEHTISQSPGTLQPRQKQLSEIGIDWKKEYQIQEYLQIIRQHMQRKYGMKFRQAERPSEEKLAKAS